ncbi:hypothetical protein HOL34_01710 [bacterium]|jgi:hypothetical protein|nr:hypothetical protein [bacterium]MBT3903896.1 hypothetical protein [bacterium]MBT4577845.1 hypothetical protein [bacterium]MBT5346026.1 hypothetical protein [bacterium]MBT6131263.1 hypothetical protein [bacterium]
MNKKQWLSGMLLCSMLGSASLGSADNAFVKVKKTSKKRSSRELKEQIGQSLRELLDAVIDCVELVSFSLTRQSEQLSQALSQCSACLEHVDKFFVPDVLACVDCTLSHKQIVDTLKANKNQPLSLELAVDLLGKAANTQRLVIACIEELLLAERKGPYGSVKRSELAKSVNGLKQYLNCWQACINNLKLACNKN